MPFTDEEKNLEQWKRDVIGMDHRDLDPRAQDKGNVYNHFINHIKVFTTSVLSGEAHGYNYMNDATGVLRGYLNEGSKLPDDWWEIATEIGEGKKADANAIARVMKPRRNNKYVYDTFMPAYRAIKENFDKRFKLFSWIFDHARYTAERDALKALSGLMQALTGDTKETLDRQYRTHVSEVAFSKAEEKALRREDNLARKEHKKAKTNNVVSEKKEVVVEEDNIKLEPQNDKPEENKFQVEINPAEFDYVNDKIYENLSATERGQKLREENSFKNAMMKQIMNCIRHSRIPEDLKRTKAISQIYEELMEYAVDVICDTCDDYEREPDAFDNIHNMMDVFAKTMFEKAYTSLDGFKIPEEKKLIAAQRLANLFLTKATPVGFTPEKYGKYGNNYAIKFRDNVIELMKKDTEYNIAESIYGKILDDTMNELGSREAYAVDRNDLKSSNNNVTYREYYEAHKKIDDVDINAIRDEDVANFFKNK